MKSSQLKSLIYLILCVSLIFHSAGYKAHAQSQCSTYFHAQKYTSQIVNSKFKTLLPENARGYAVIVSVMLFSAGVSSFISAHIAKDYPFMTYFISQLSILGIVVIGAPIWEPLSSYVRSKAFRLKKDFNPNNSFDKSYLEELWHETQLKYSINSQMSRNVVTSALNNIQLNLYHSYKAFQEGDKHYAILQISSMAVRLRTLFSEIHPRDEQVQLAFRSILSIEELKNKNPDLKSEILKKISELDPDSVHPQNQGYYQNLVAAWLD